MPSEHPPFEQIEAALRRAASALRDADVPFMLGGSLASWARGGPRPWKDVDLMVTPADADDARAALEASGLTPVESAEDWLHKFCHEAAPIDLIWRPRDLEITRETIAAADEISVLGLPMRVMRIEDVLVSKLLALDEHNLSYESLLQIARSLREQIDWVELHSRTSASPYAAAFFALIAELKLDGDAGIAGRSLHGARDRGRRGGRRGSGRPTPPD